MALGVASFGTATVGAVVSAGLFVAAATGAFVTGVLSVTCENAGAAIEAASNTIN
jgi:hypothetical protein